MMRLAYLSAIGCLALCFFPDAVQPQDSGAGPQPLRYAVLIGAQEYLYAPKLRYTLEDVEQLAKTLKIRGGYEVIRILEPRAKPLKPAGSDEAGDLGSDLYTRHGQRVQDELPNWLKVLGPNDTMLVYFTGHGFRDNEGRLYLAPIDCDPADAAATGIPAQWLRDQLAACKAKIKLLVLDACHAGSDKGDDKSPSVAAKDLGMAFKNATGVVTMASSQSDEKSLIWQEKKQSLFSYWLNQGLKGHADKDGDGVVTFEELYDYTCENVADIAKRRFEGAAQTPARIIPGDAPAGSLAVIAPKPRSLREVLDDMAEEIATTMQLRSLARVGVLEFTNDTRMGELLGANYGLLGRYCTEEVEKRLVKKCGDKFDVVDRRALREALAKSQFRVGDVGTERLKGLADEVKDGMPAAVFGTLRDRTSRVVTVRGELKRTGDHKLVLPTGGTAQLNDSEWAMLGRSTGQQLPGLFGDGSLPPGGPGTLGGRDGPERPPEDRVVDELDRLSQGAHPLSNPRFPYRVQIVVDGRPRQGRFVGNNLFVPLRRGEVYQIWLKNNARQPVMLRLLVDGLNTLPDRNWEQRDADHEKEMMVEGRDPLQRRKEKLYPMQRVNLDEARAWKLDAGRQYSIGGFFTATGKQGELYEFKVVDAQQSLAARQEYTDQVGLITAAFYEPQFVAPSMVGPSRAPRIGTGKGRRVQQETETYENVQVGALLAVVHIRYVEPEALEKAGQE